MQYPKYKYHAEKEAVVVHSEEHEKSLGAEWADSPAHHGIETCPGAAPDPMIAKKAAELKAAKEKKAKA